MRTRRGAKRVEYQWMKEGEEKMTVEGDKSCQVRAVNWFMATASPATIVFRVHFKEGELKLRFKRGTM